MKLLEYRNQSTSALPSDFILRVEIFPGIEIFDSGSARGEVDLVRSVFFLNLPKLAVQRGGILDLRADAQAHGLAEFWQLIESEYQYAQVHGQSNQATGQKIRADSTGGVVNSSV